VVVVEAVQLDERVRLDGLHELPARIRQWEEASAPDDAEVEALGS
jgi:hypothetical protein